MNDNKYRDACKHLEFSEDFEAKTGERLALLDLHETKRRPFFRLISAAVVAAACLALVFFALPGLIGLLSVVSPTVSASIETNASETAKRFVIRSSDYPQGVLVDYLAPEPGDVQITAGVQFALDHQTVEGAYYYVSICLLTSELYKNSMDQYTYRGRTIGEWTILVDLSLEQYPYNEYNGDFGGAITLDEWQRRQQEAKTLHAQENLDAAIAEYHADVLPGLEATHTSLVQSEVQRLKDLGYDVFYEQPWDNLSASENPYFDPVSALLTKDQLLNFQASSEIGYSIDWVSNGHGIANWEE